MIGSVPLGDGRTVLRPAVAVEVVRHHLRLFGVNERAVGQIGRGHVPALWVVAHASEREILDTAARGTVVVALTPSSSLCASLGIDFQAGGRAPWRFTVSAEATVGAAATLRSLHPWTAFTGGRSEPLVCADSGEGAWSWMPYGRAGVLLIGTDLAGDLVRYRQGDPEQVRVDADRTCWGFWFERANYLFESQRAGEHPGERHADLWAATLTRVVSQRTGCPAAPLLPANAAGALVVTGDDDQAYLEKYAAQLSALAGTPVTYFLHPGTRHTRRSLRDMLSGRRVDLGLHPDALDRPHQYDATLASQARWFRGLTGQRPLSVRNHGFLNRGYWGHLDAWRRQGIALSANLSGLDGCVLNGSLLPARVAVGEELTEHWSLLTAFGDGMLSLSGLSDEAAAARVYDFGTEMVRAGLPGVLMINLHPQNVSETRSLHAAVVELGRRHLLVWTLRDCLEWFAERDGSARCLGTRGRSRWLSTLSRWMSPYGLAIARATIPRRRTSVASGR